MSDSSTGRRAADPTTAGFLKDYMEEFRDHVVRVLTVLPRPGG